VSRWTSRVQQARPSGPTSRSDTPSKARIAPYD